MNIRFRFRSTLFLLVLFIACKTKTDTANRQAAPDSAATSEPYYPITQCIQGQIAYVDTTPLAIEKQTFANSRRIDSVLLDRPTFAKLAADFMQPDLNQSTIKPLYRESKFHDLTINTLTFSYNATDPNQPIQQRDILLDPETQKVKTVLFRKVEQHGDTIITVNGLWQHDMNFQLSYLIEPKNGPMQTRQVKVVWDRPFTSN